jgi:hypothetical protein
MALSRALYLMTKELAVVKFSKFRAAMKVLPVVDSEVAASSVASTAVALAAAAVALAAAAVLRN